jgi:arginyl-tRNA--protein-N-Asp/Glu arginylyltransferase
MRHRPSCKKCKSINSVKNGHNRSGIQRYKCKDCEAVFTWKYKRKTQVVKHKEKRRIMDCYADGGELFKLLFLSSFRLIFFCKFTSFGFYLMKVTLIKILFSEHNFILFYCLVLLNLVPFTAGV